MHDAALLIVHTLSDNTYVKVDTTLGCNIESCTFDGTI